MTLFLLAETYFLHIDQVEVVLCELLANGDRILLFVSIAVVVEDSRKACDIHSDRLQAPR